MGIHKKICELLKARKLTKREFARRLVLSVNEDALAEKTVYAYLDGSIKIKAELISVIARILDIPEQELFGTNEKTRIMLLKSILTNASEHEINIARTIIGEPSSCKNLILSGDDFFSIAEVESVISLLKYAPRPFIKNLHENLMIYKKTFETCKL